MRDLKRQDRKTSRPPTITWAVRGAGWFSVDGRFQLLLHRCWVLTDTQATGLIKEQAVHSLKAGQRRAEQIIEGEGLPKEPWQPGNK